MRIIGIDIQNFRKLFGCHIDISKETTLFVGANNSGKTSAMDALAKFLANRSFVFNDITIAKRIDINRIGTKWVEADCEQPLHLHQMPTHGWQKCGADHETGYQAAPPVLTGLSADHRQYSGG